MIPNRLNKNLMWMFQYQIIIRWDWIIKHLLGQNSKQIYLIKVNIIYLRNTNLKKWFKFFSVQPIEDC